MRTSLGYDGKPFKSVTQGGGDLDEIPLEDKKDKKDKKPAKKKAKDKKSGKKTGKKKKK